MLWKWEWKNDGYSFDDFVATFDDEEEHKCIRTCVHGSELVVVEFHHLHKGKVVARTSPFTVFNGAMILPPQVVASWCETLGINTEEYGLDEVVVAQR